MTGTVEDRLENMSPIGVDQDGNLLVKHEDWFWLQEQTGRVQELEEQKEFFRKSLVELKAVEVILRKENTELSTANDDLYMKSLQLEVDKELLRLALEKSK